MRIGKILGIDIIIDVSWLFVFALVVWSLTNNVGLLRSVAIPPLPRIILAFITAILFFSSVLLHELAHSLVARLRGLRVRGIRLFIFGGVSLIEDEADNAPAEAWISLVGPLVSLGLFLAFSSLSSVLGQGQTLHPPVDRIGLAYAYACGYLAFANLLLACFNLLPAYPLDGGRVMHALIWKFTKNRARATTIAVIVGRVIAIAIVMCGIYVTLVEGGLGSGLWLTFIGYFLFQAGEAERVVARLHDALRGHRASELAGESILKLPADANAEDALAQLLTSQVSSAPIFIGERFLGVVNLQDLVRVSDPAHTYVTAVMINANEVPVIDADADAGEITRRLSRGKYTLLPVMKNGDLLGFITRETVLSWMAKEPAAAP